ncbi:MAG: hypothetical protein ACFBSD_04680 [Paracoccaceae bacterium]
MRVTFGMIGAALLVSPAAAATIDFETQPTGVLSTLTVDGIEVSFDCAPGACFVFGYGGPTEAFAGAAGPDTPLGGLPNPTVGGQGLTDEADGPLLAPNGYDIAFSEAVTDISFDIIDLDGSTLTVDLFSNADFTGLLGTATFTGGDGAIVPVDLSSVTGGVLSLSLGVTTPGSAIDNLAFTAVEDDGPTTIIPVPPTLALFLSGLLGFAWTGFRRA